MLPNIPKKKSAADVEIRGSSGDFSVSQGDRSTLRVHYMLGHVGLDRDGDQQEKVLSCLQPFREVFDVKNLDFDQIMQRDIDDARVSNELIPYLLEQASSGLVKLFPPIIVVVLPTDSSSRMASHYPTVQTTTESEDGVDYQVIRSGAHGQEVFELRRWIHEGKVHSHDFASLRFNRERSKLVIVDGQHRAMSLLALYRNIKGWPDRAKNVEAYYKMWTPRSIEQFDLRSARLPVMFCVFPQIDGCDPAFTLPIHAACRSIFLALNKNAKAVTRSRNILLDDRDVIATFLRRMLGYIKDRDTLSSERMRIWSVELDNEHNRMKLQSPMAITGVTHLHSLLERLLLSDIPSTGLSARPQNLWLKKDLESCYARLGMPTRATDDGRHLSRRDERDASLVGRLSDAFERRYLPILVRGLDAFAPYSAHHNAAGRLLQSLGVDAMSAFYRNIFFEAEGAQRVFDDFRKQLDDRVKDDPDVSPEIRQTRDEFRKRAQMLEDQVRSFLAERTCVLLSTVGPDLRAASALNDWIEQVLYRETLTTAAFQHALFLTFFSVVQSLQERLQGHGPSGAPLDDAALHELFEEYLSGLNAFFQPRRYEGARNLVGVFHGELTRDGKVDESSYCLRNILVHGELKPDEWPKFRAILQELWRSDRDDVNAVLRDAREDARVQALQRYIQRRLKERRKDLGVSESALSAADRAQIEGRCAEEVVKAFEPLGARLNARDLLTLARASEPDEAEG